MAKEKKVPATKVGQLMDFVRGLDVVLHPRIIEAMEKRVWEARTEMAQDARNQKFSRELQELEPLLEQFRQSVKTYGDAPPSYFFHLRPIIKKIIELYGNQSEKLHH